MFVALTLAPTTGCEVEFDSILSINPPDCPEMEQMADDELRVPSTELDEIVPMITVVLPEAVDETIGLDELLVSESDPTLVVMADKVLLLLIVLLVEVAAGR